MKSPQNPTLGPGETAKLPRSLGFEGMASSKDGKTLYPMLEGALTTDPDQQRREPGYSLGDLTELDESRLLMIERDPQGGPAAAFKRIFVLDLRRLAAGGFLVKEPAVDLLNVADPDLISLPARPGDFGPGDPFEFPFETIRRWLPSRQGFFADAPIRQRATHVGQSKRRRPCGSGPSPGPIRFGV